MAFLRLRCICVCFLLCTKYMLIGNHKIKFYVPHISYDNRKSIGGHERRQDVWQVDGMSTPNLQLCFWFAAKCLPNYNTHVYNKHAHVITSLLHALCL